MAGALSYHLYAYLGIPEDDIPSHLKELFSTLNSSFGVSSNVIGKAIVRRLYAKLGLTFVEMPNVTLIQYIEDAKLKFITDPKTRNEKQLTDRTKTPQK